MSCFSNPQLYTSNISIAILEYLNHTFILQYQNNITNTEISFSTLPFVCDWSDWRYSFLQWDQNSLAMCWTWHHLLRQYKSGLLKSTGGGITTFNFIVSMFDGARGKPLVGSLMVTTVNGSEFRIPSVSATSVGRDPLSSDFPCVKRRDDSIAWADLICLSQTTCSWWVSNPSH